MIRSYALTKENVLLENVNLENINDDQIKYY